MSTTVSNPGRLLSASFNSAPVAFVPLAGAPQATPTPITPQDADVTVVLASTSSVDPGGDLYFQLSSDFAVGALVEFYQVNAGNGNPTPAILDENGNEFASGAAIILRKIATGSGRGNWGWIA
jgi:hypothetical protein